MDKGIKATLCVTCAFAVMFAAVTGCAVKFTHNDTDPAASGTTDNRAGDKTTDDPAPVVTDKLPDSYVVINTGGVMFPYFLEFNKDDI